MARGRRRRKFTWLPTLGGDVAGDPQIVNTVTQFELQVPADGSLATGLIPLLPDSPQEHLNTRPDEGMGEIIGNEYLLRRIVGKCQLFHELVQGQDPQTPFTALYFGGGTVVGVGVFVARADFGNTQPIGAGQTGNVTYNVLGAHNDREPWVWRRTWHLGFKELLTPVMHGNQYVQVTSGGVPFNNTSEFLSPLHLPAASAAAAVSASNIDRGSALDGPHVDAKTIRRVGQDDRLWLAMSVQTFPNPATLSASEFQKFVRIAYDFRFLGALRKARNRGAF